MVILCCVLAVGLVNTGAGHRYLLGLAQRQASQALGVPARVENFAIHPASLSLDLYGIRVSGAAPYSDPPLLQADRIEVGIRIASVLRREWYFDRIEIDHPVVWMVEDKDSVSNLPVFKSSGSSHTDLFDLGIRRFAIARGEVWYNSRPAAVSADLHDLEFRSSFNKLLAQYSGRLAYSNGRLAVGSYRPLEHDLDAGFVASRSEFTLKHGIVKAGDSEATLGGTLENYGNPSVHAQYRIVVDGKQARQFLRQPAIPDGIVQAAGVLEFRRSANRSVIDSLTVNGDLMSARLALDSGAARINAANLAAHYSLANGNAALHDLRLETLGGIVTAEGSMEEIGGDTRSRFHANLQNLSLAQARSALGRWMPVNGTSLDGRTSASVTASWGKTIGDLTAHADLTVAGRATRSGPRHSRIARSSLAGQRPGSGAAVPFEGAFHAAYSRAGRNLTLNHSYLRSSQTTVNLNGAISRSSSLAVSLDARDLGEMDTLADLFRASGSGGSSLELRGQASFQGMVRGSIEAPEVTGQLTGKNIAYRGTQWRSLRAGVGFSADRASLKDLHLQGVDREQVSGNAGIGLRHGSPSSGSPIQVDLNASQLNLASIAKIAGRQIPATGTLNLSAHLRGEASNPAGNANIKLTGASVQGEPVNQAVVDLTGSGREVQASAVVQLPAGAIQAHITADPQAKTFNAGLQSGGINLAKLQAVQSRGIHANGVVELQAHGQGSFDNPRIDATLEIPTLAVSGQVISQTRLQVRMANRTARLETSSSVAGALLHGKANVNLEGDDLADASLDTQPFALAPLLALYAPDAQVNGQAEIHATIHGPLKKPKQLEAHVRLSLPNVAYNAIQVSASPIQADLHNGTVTLQPVMLQGTGTQLKVRGAYPLGGAAPASLQAIGAINLQILQVLDPDLHASGQLKVNIHSQGAFGSNLLGGEIDIAGANLSTADSPVALEGLSGVLKVTNDRIEIAGLEGKLGGGEITGQGAILYRPGIHMDLGVAVKDARLLYPPGVRETANVNLRLNGSTDHAMLTGSVDLADMSFTPQFDLSAVVNRFSGGVEAPAGPGFAQNLDLNIALNSSANTNLVSRTLSVAGSANLQIRGTAAQPVILGRVNLNSGDVILNGNRFVLTGGTVQFLDPSMTRPVLNVSLNTTIQEYKIDLRFQGPADQLRTQYTSDPSLPPADIIHLLAFGQTTGASATNNTPMNQQAEGLVASQVSGQVTSRISQSAGISQLSISPVIAGGTAAGPPGANLTLQQRVTGKLFVTFSTNVATTQGQTIQGQYQVSPRVAISATRDPNGGFALDTMIKKSW